MGITCFTQEFTTTVAASRMFRALIIDSHNLIPKLVPQGIKSIEFIKGNGGARSIKADQFHRSLPGNRGLLLGTPGGAIGSKEGTFRRIWG
ncbi:hypothetical protein CRG98_038952 [Punica granatum]|uniref:Uncharacterized protein n=1 Tax=Punica granatum TaxID=22663 RepID=A0A2I0I9M1_PUNGR|nr:hypothetical protein CRG98_038952 [Punica granatum]